MNSEPRDLAEDHRCQRPDLGSRGAIGTIIAILKLGVGNFLIGVSLTTCLRVDEALKAEYCAPGYVPVCLLISYHNATTHMPGTQIRIIRITCMAYASPASITIWKLH